MTLAERLGRNVARMRAARKMTQARLAEAAEMTSDEVSRVERGAREPRFATIEKLADALGVDVGELFGLPPSETLGAVAPTPTKDNARLARMLDGLTPRTRDALFQLCRALVAEQP